MPTNAAIEKLYSEVSLDSHVMGHMLMHSSHVMVMCSCNLIAQEDTTV